MITDTTDLTTEQKTRLVSLLQDPIYELIPLKNALKEASHLPAGAAVSVTASPSKGMASTATLAAELASRGFRAIPHLSARLTESHTHLESIIEACRVADISEALVVGGDGDPVGPFPDGLSLLEAMSEMGHPFTRIGIAGYPEGHPSITEDELQRALRDKQEFAASVTTQMCFSEEAVVAWVGEQRRGSIELPVIIGIPGVVEVRRLLGIAGRIGVGGSRRFLSAHTGLGRLVRPGGYTPDALLTALAPLCVDPSAAVEGVHIYAFNQAETTERWRKAFVVELGG